jgi:4-hydroxybutyrate CoA-transferase
MNYVTEYKSKVVSIEEAARHIRSGDFVGTALALGAWSRELANAICARYGELEDVTLSDSLQMDPEIILYNEEFLKMADGRINFCPGFGTALIRGINSKKLSDLYTIQGTDSGKKLAAVCDVWITQVTPPNKHGFVNLGLTNMWTMDTIRYGRASGKQRLTIGEVNDQQPIVYGENWHHVSEFDLFVENPHPMKVFKRAVPGEKEETIAKYILDLIDDGCTIQMGIGTIPEAVISHLGQKNDLGVVSEMFPTGLPQLIEQGVVTNQRKPFHKGVNVATFCLGDEDMYDYVTENPSCLFFPGSYTDNSAFIAQHPDFVAMNMAVMVDLSGQICSEGIGHKQISSPGGQLDFQMGAYQSTGGKAITVLTAARTINGKLVSSIVPELPPGTPVTVPRHYADYIVTEYGVAHIRCKSRRQRAEALIEVAHPDFREELREALKQNFYPYNGRACA